MANHAAITAAATNPATTADSAPWLLLWQQLLKTWATDGSLTAAALEALQLEHTPGLLNELNNAWALGDFADLPPIELLSETELSGALGAYAASTASIYLNSDWLSSASHEQIHAVLTEELGHHLDSLLNITDTPGDEGELFAAQLHGIPYSSEQLVAIGKENDHGFISTGGHNIAIEKSDNNSTPIIRGNSLYTIVDGPSWTEAEATAVEIGGHLVTINDEPENEFVWRTLGVNKWIGLTDQEHEGQWKWTSGEPITYENWVEWARGQNTGEDYGWLWGQFPGMWDDNSVTGNWTGTTPVTTGIAEFKFIRRGDSAYVLVEGATWPEAEANAQKIGGHLTTVNDIEENNWLAVNFGLLGEGAWIGLNDKDNEGNWTWSSGETSEFRNWDSGEPNGGASENYVNLRGTNRGGRWNDLGRSLNLHEGAQFVGGIAEIALAPNNSPTGSPVLNGNPKIGETISIDATGVEDADNFEGWTPTYEYSWQTSQDNGSTWHELLSEDAIDNNPSYTLSTENIGQQIRGVLSYLDGHGTQEKLTTDAVLIRTGENTLSGEVREDSVTESSTIGIKLGNKDVSLTCRCECDVPEACAPTRAPMEVTGDQ